LQIVEFNYANWQNTRIYKDLEFRPLSTIKILH